MKTELFRMRIEPELKAIMEAAVKEGKAKSMSQLVTRAVKEYLKT